MNTLCFLLVLSYISACIQGCDILGPVGVEVGGTAVFQYSSVSVSGTTIYEVRRGDDDAKVIATYSSGSPSTLLTDTNITFTGNHTTGDIGFSFAHVQRSDNGTYILQTSGGQQLQCLTLYVFGVVNATLSVDKNRINEGGKVDFTCSAATMTVPDGIPMSYSWTLDGTAITGSGDMTYTISKATESDKGKYACTVTEDVAGGRTFVSNEIVLEVIGTTSTTTNIRTTSTTSSATTGKSTTTAGPSLTLNTTHVSLPASARTTTAVFTSATVTTIPATAVTISAGSSRSATTFMIAATKTKATSDQALITMIIVVSVTGGILVLAIFVLMFRFMHWKKCFLCTVHHKHRDHSSNYTKRSRQYHKWQNTCGEYPTTQMENALENYYFYKGKINPVYDGTVVINNCYLNEGTFQDHEYTEQLAPVSYLYDYNWKQMDRP